MKRFVLGSSDVQHVTLYHAQQYLCYCYLLLIAIAYLCQYAVFWASGGANVFIQFKNKDNN